MTDNTVPATLEPEERILTFGNVFGRDAGGIVVLLVLAGAMTLASEQFLTGDNLANLSRQVAIFGIIAVGQLMVIITAGIDLSVGSVLGLSGCLTAELLFHGANIPVAIIAGLVSGVVVGMVNGWLVAYAKLPPFIVTLGMLGIARGVVLVLTDAATVQPLPDAFAKIANGTLLGLPNLLWLLVIVVAGGAFVLRRTVFGRYLYAIGSNPESARLSGVPVTRMLLAVYAIAGLLAAVGGVLFASRLNAGIPHRRHRLRAQRHRRLRDRRGQSVRRQGHRHGRRGRRADRGHPEQRRKPARDQLLLPADHHRPADPARRPVRPVPEPPHPHRLTRDNAGALLAGVRRRAVGRDQFARPAIVRSRFDRAHVIARNVRSVAPQMVIRR
jgi:ribose transport system permease protein